MTLRHAKTRIAICNDSNWAMANRVGKTVEWRSPA
jgi:hypothetical protein